MEEQKPLETPETPKTKQELFEANPDNFVSLDNIVIALMRTPKGPAMFCRPISRPEAIMAKGECDLALTGLILRMDVKAEQARNKIIQPPKGGIMSFVRNNKRT
jgi:hypothetical protein